LAVTSPDIDKNEYIHDDRSDIAQKEA